MKKLHALALSMLLTPIVTLGSAAVLAQQTAAQPDPTQQQSNQQQSNQQQRNQQQPGTAQGNTAAQGQSAAQTAAERRNTASQGQSTAQTAAERRNTAGQSGMERRGYMDSAPMNGMRLSDLMDAEVTTVGDENIGPVTDVIIDESGRIVALVVGVGGFLGMGEREVAIGWDDVTRTRSGDDQELRVNLTRDSLRSAPEFRGGMNN